MYHTLILKPGSYFTEHMQKTLMEEGFLFQWIDHLDTILMDPPTRALLENDGRPLLMMDETCLLRYFREIADPSQRAWVFVAQEIDLSQIEIPEVIEIESEVFDLPFVLPGPEQA